jgi:hypothetical protein
MGFPWYTHVPSDVILGNMKSQFAMWMVMQFRVQSCRSFALASRRSCAAAARVSQLAGTRPVSRLTTHTASAAEAGGGVGHKHRLGLTCSRVAALRSSPCSASSAGATTPVARYSCSWARVCAMAQRTASAGASSWAALQQKLAIISRRLGVARREEGRQPSSSTWGC